jgi:methionyl-tRNA formyltransferase
MKVLIVTSQVTFVPRNYNDLVIGLAAHQHVAGMVEIKNRDFSLLMRSLGLCCFVAPRLGFQLLRNIFRSMSGKRRRAYTCRNKTFARLKTVNCEEMLRFISSHEIDLVLNARTRVIFKENILNAPPLGCINLHHGILPAQRGTMCDLWALSEGAVTGFSIHKMTRITDDGPVLLRESRVHNNKNYIDYLGNISKREKEAVWKLLDTIAEKNACGSGEEFPACQVVYRRHPNMRELKTMKQNGLII